MFWPCETRTSTCRNFATISSGLYRFLAIAVLLAVKDIPQVGPLQWGWISAAPVSVEFSLMAKQATDTRRKLVEFDAKTWHALNLLSRESMKTFQKLADEAFRDLLHKYGRPTDLKAALRESARPSAKPDVSRRRRPKERH